MTSRIAGVLVVAALFATPLIIHLAVLLGWPDLVIHGLVGVQLAALFTAGLAKAKVTPPWLNAVIGSASALAILAGLGRAGSLIASGVPHAVIHLALLGVFADSLRSGRIPLITGVISRIRGPLPPELVAYGRHLTIAWCVYFAAQIVVSAGLFLLAPLATWSFFVNGLSYPLLFVMFGAEYAFRLLRFRHLPRSRLSDMVKAIMRWRDPSLAAPRTGGDGV